MSVQIKKNGVWEAVAGNATNTSGITESSALANIGTSANATQHDINVAIDGFISDIGTIIQNEGSVHPTTEADFGICSISVPAGTWIIGCFSELNFDGPNSTYNNVIKSPALAGRTVRTVEKNGGGSYVSMFVTLSATTTFTACGYGTYDLVANTHNKQHSFIQAIRIK